MSEVADILPREFRSAHRFARIAPDKVRLVARAISGMPVPAALDALSVMNKRAAVLMRKVLQTAVANGQDQDADLDPEDLYVTVAKVDEGPPMKRYRFRAYGRVARIRRRTSHITVVVSTKPRG